MKIHTTTVMITLEFKRANAVTDEQAQEHADGIVRDRIGTVGVRDIEVVDHESIADEKGTDETEN